ncbi:MAG TPA: winged helix-turn-helix domain-containing protein [Gammaproteobacteria bacterium]|nr:winged helix-turn-helix domain-containing protein [Gammaproteobacteria bacterium]
MARVTRIAPHLTLDELRQKLHTATKPWLRQRWLVIYTAMLEPRPAQAIATQLGVSRPFVAKITSLYKRFGPSGLETIGPGGRRNAYLSPDEETAFLAPFLERAAHGDIVTAKVIHHAFEQHIGHTVDESTIYRLLQRHQWRKVMPRSYHPEADLEAQTSFKKTSLRSSLTS